MRSRGKIPYEVAQQVLEEEQRSQHSTPESLGDICAPELQDKDDAVAVGQAICALQKLAAQMRARRLAACANEFIMPGDDRNGDGMFCVDRETGHVRARECLPRRTDSGESVDQSSFFDGQESHQLVEEFMLLANRLVAQKLEGALETVGGGAVLRAQLPPSQARLKSWCELCLEHGYSDQRSRSDDELLDVNTIPRVVCDLIGQLQATRRQQRQQRLEPEESVAVAEALQWIATRSNTAAKYVYTSALGTLAGVEPSQSDDQNADTALAAELETRRHYSLNCSAYTHFTSPIRRYADLIVHRQLRAVLAAEKETHGALESSVNPVALEKALAQQGVSRAQVIALVERTNHQAKAAKYAQQDCERLLALRFVAERRDGIEMLAVALAVDEICIKLLLPTLDLEHTVRLNDLGCKSVWKADDSLLRVFLSGDNGRGEVTSAEPCNDVVETEEGNPQVVDISQLSVVRVLARASFGGNDGRGHVPRLWVKLIAPPEH